MTGRWLLACALSGLGVFAFALLNVSLWLWLTTGPCGEGQTTVAEGSAVDVFCDAVVDGAPEPIALLVVFFPLLLLIVATVTGVTLRHLPTVVMAFVAAGLLLGLGAIVLT
jgi:hypothetical protein